LGRLAVCSRQTLPQPATGRQEVCTGMLMSIFQLDRRSRADWIE
jgi:hypothetical protein